MGNIFVLLDQYDSAIYYYQHRRKNIDLDHCEVHFELIFTTSYDQYAIRAIRFSALEYLLKPIDRDELQRSVQKAIKRNASPLPQQLEMLIEKNEK
ncbi:MAG: hypothetical protein ABI366_09155 [Ginsengibacter sp.]